MKKITAIILTLFSVVFLLTGCGQSKELVTEDDEKISADISNVEEEPEEAPIPVGNTIGVSMPTKKLQRWNQDGSHIQRELEAAGYQVNLAYADNTAKTQAEQIEEMITEQCSVLVIAPVEGDSLSGSLAKAKEAGIPVISYDRLLLNSDAVSYYVTFDNYLIGTFQGEAIVDALNPEDTPEPIYMEIFTGDAEDNNTRFFYSGAMEVLQPFIDQGKIVVRSGQTNLEDTSTPKWSLAQAGRRMKKLLSNYYTEEIRIDAVLCANDSIALGVEEALGAEYTEDYPYITGQDCDVANIKLLQAGRQGMDIFKDTRELARQAASMVTSIMTSGTAEVNGEAEYDNGTGIIPTYMCKPEVCTLDNYEKLLIESGYYKEEQIKK